MKTYKRTFLLFLICLLLPFFSYSQKSANEQESLSSILVKVEKQYDIKFTFANKIIKGLTVIPFDSNLSLKEAIDYLENNTSLNFTFLTDKNILISAEVEMNTICGYLIDINANTVVEGAHILVLNTSVKTASDDKGYFKFNLIDKNQVVQITHISYPTIYLNSTDFLTSKSCLTISLTQKIEALNEVILHNYLTSGILVKTDNSVTVNTQDFGILPGLIAPDVLHQIQALPGISSANETISNINIRGGTNDQNLLLWDGIKMYHSGHFFGLISAFNPYLTDHVSVIKDGTGPQYNDGVSGTITIESIDIIKDKPFGGGGFNLLSADAFAQIPISKDLAIQFSGRRSIIDFLKTPTFEQYFKRAFQDTKLSGNPETDNRNISTKSDFNFYDYSFKLLYDLNEKHKIRISFLNVENSLNHNEELQASTFPESKTSTLNQKNIAVGLRTTNKWNNKIKTVFRAYFTKYNIDASNYTLLEEQRLLQSNEVLETGLSFDSYFDLNKNIQILSGYQYAELGIKNAEDVNTPLYVRTIKQVVRSHAIYGQVKIVSKNNKLLINSGLRLNYLEKFAQFNLEPRLQAMYKINSHFSVKISGEYKSQKATQIIDLQEDFLGVEKRRWVLSDNISVPIIKSKQASAGFNFKKRNVSVNMEGFYKTVSGITTSSQGFQNQNQFLKTYGSYTVKGIEFSINRKTASFSTWLGYTFNKNNYEFLELTPSVFPNNLDIRHTVSIGNTYTYKSLNFAVGLIWRTGKPLTIPLDNNSTGFNGISRFINYQSPNSDRLTDYFRADFSSTFKFKLNGKINAMAGISVLNLFDNKNILNTYYKINSENIITKVNNTSIGVTPNFTFRVSF